MTHAPPARSAFVERIDGAHANAKRKSKEMDEPEYLKRPEVERLQESSRIEREPQPWKYAERTAHLDVELPPHAVAAVTLEFLEDEGRGGASW